MGTYPVTITGKLKLNVEVEASSRLEAEWYAKQLWKSGEYILDSSHFTDVTFKSVPPKKERGMDR